MPEKIDELSEAMKENFKSFAGEEGETHKLNKKTTSINVIDLVFLSKLPPGAMYVLYLSSISFKAKKPFDIDRLSPSPSFKSVIEYFEGYLSALSIFGVLKFSVANNIWSIKAFDDKIGDNMKDLIIKKWKKSNLEEEYPIEIIIKRVKDYFA